MWLIKKNILLFLLMFVFFGLIVSNCDKSDSSAHNTAPEAFFVVSPWTGSTTTQFSFNATYCTDKQDADTMLLIRWDWENDGTWDTEWSKIKIVIHRYDEEGTFTIAMEVKDSQGLINNVTQNVFIDNTGTEWLGKPCPGLETVTYEGQVYNTVRIGDQCWFRENLNYAVENSQCLGYDSVQCESFGRLYNWQAALTACPDGWHLPGDEDWKNLEGYVDVIYDEGDPEWDKYNLRGYDAGENLKSSSGWYMSGEGTNKFNFTALPGGVMYAPGFFQYSGQRGYWWSSTEVGETKAISRSLLYDQHLVRRSSMNKEYMLSVRCIKSDY